MTKWLSVIMPTWNGGKYLQNALDSILCQKEDDLEIIAIDDGSADSTLQLLESYACKLPIRIIRLEHTGNWVANTNLGLSFAKGRYVSFLHQDDIWLPNRLNILKKIINKYPDVLVFLHPSYFIDRTGRQIGIWKCPLPEYQVISGNRIFPKLLVQNFISIPASCFDREAAIKAGLLDERLWYTADWKLWLKLSLMGQWLYYPYPLSGFRIHSSSLTVTGSANLSEFKYQLQTILDEFLPVLNNISEISRFHAKRENGKLKTLKVLNPRVRGEFKVSKLAEFSMSVNIAMVSLARKQPFDIKQLLKYGFSLTLTEWRRYIEYSRIIERSMARIKINLNPNPKGFENP